MGIDGWKYNGYSIYEEMRIPHNTVIYNIGNLETGDRKPLGTDNLSVQYSQDEFITFNKPDLLIDVSRSKYLGSPEICCFNKVNFYWANKERTSHKFKRDDDHPYLVSCDPSSQRVTSSFCNIIIKKKCFIDKIDSPMCSSWFLLLQNQILDRNQMNDDMYKNCKDNITNKYCIEWIRGIRSTDNIDVNSLADSVIYNQLDKTKLKCAFPPDFVYKSSTPYECWYPPCITEPIEHLTFKNLVNRKRCHVYMCNIDIKDLKVGDDVKMSLECATKRDQSMENIIKNKTLITDNTHFPLLRYVHFFILIVFSLLFLLFFKL